MLSPRWDFYPRPVLAFGYCRCLRLSVCVSVRPCVNHELVRAITHDPFQLGSPNLGHRCKRPWLRSLLFWGVIDLDLQGQILLQSQNLPHFELVCVITHHPFKPGPPNLDSLTSKSCLFASRLRLWNICQTCKKRMKRSLFHILNGYAHICSPTETCLGPWNSRVVSLVWPLLASQSSTRRLTMDFLMLL